MKKGGIKNLILFTGGAQVYFSKSDTVWV